jgi:hypothetical protein
MPSSAATRSTGCDGEQETNNAMDSNEAIRFMTNKPPMLLCIKSPKNQVGLGFCGLSFLKKISRTKNVVQPLFAENIPKNIKPAFQFRVIRVFSGK